MNPTRREFLRQLGYGAGGAAFVSALDAFMTTNALAQTTGGYKALVCVFLFGGNDSNNMVVPYEDEPNNTIPGVSYTKYSAERSASQLAQVKNNANPAFNLIPISPNRYGATTNTFSLNPNFANFTLAGVTIPGFASRFNEGVGAVVCNVGPLVQFLTGPSYRAGGARPASLFSHSDQQAEWQNGTGSNTGVATGWGGRCADKTLLLNARTGDPGGTRFPMITSIAGSPIFSIGQQAKPLAIAPAPTALNQVLVLNGFGTAADEVARRNAFNYLRTVDRGYHLVRASQDITQQAIDVSQALNVNPTIAAATPFPNTNLGNQLLQVAKVIKANKQQSVLNLNRQIFFVSLGGFDTHQNEITGQGGYRADNNTLVAGLLGQLNQALSAFYYWTVNDPDLGNISGEVTAFTLSDFARTFNPSGTGAAVVGTDHAWGSHQLVLGGSVVGKDFYGRPMPGGNGSVFPSLIKGTSTPYDADSGTGRGRWVPTVPVDLYGAELASWYGVAAGDLGGPLGVFPNLGNFNDPNTVMDFLP